MKFKEIAQETAIWVGMAVVAGIGLFFMSGAGAAPESRKRPTGPKMRPFCGFNAMDAEMQNCLDEENRRRGS